MGGEEKEKVVMSVVSVKKGEFKKEAKGEREREVKGKICLAWVSFGEINVWCDWLVCGMWSQINFYIQNCNRVDGWAWGIIIT